MTLDYQKHKNILLQILKDIFTDTSLAPFLGFKGGTAALMFYDLDRSSVDLDFDLLDDSKNQEICEKIQKIVATYGKIIDARIKRFNIIIIISYDTKAQNIKIEINRRDFGSRYELKSFLGISMQVMVQADMAAHKLCALYERLGKTNRDIYDVSFFLRHNWPINKKIVAERMNMPYINFLKKLLENMEKFNDANILAGMGELLNEKQKTWVKNKLKSDLVFLLKLAVSDEKE